MFSRFWTLQMCANKRNNFLPYIKVTCHKMVNSSSRSNNDAKNVKSYREYTTQMSGWNIEKPNIKCKRSRIYNSRNILNIMCDFLFASLIDVSFSLHLFSHSFIRSFHLCEHFISLVGFWRTAWYILCVCIVVIIVSVIIFFPCHRFLSVFSSWWIFVKIVALCFVHVFHFYLSYLPSSLPSFFNCWCCCCCCLLHFVMCLFVW